VLFSAVSRTLVSQLTISIDLSRWQGEVIPIGEIGVNTVTGGITVGPSEMTLGGDSWSPSRGIPSELKHDLGNSDWVGPRTLSGTVVGPGSVRHVRLIGFVEILTVPTIGEEGFDSDTIRTIYVKVEVVLQNVASDEIGVDVTCEVRDPVV